MDFCFDFNQNNKSFIILVDIWRVKEKKSLSKWINEAILNQKTGN